MNVRKVFFWLHLAAGATGGIVILLMSFTGVLLMYEKQIIEWIDHRDYRVAPGAQRLPLEALLAGVREQRPALPPAVVVRSDPTAPVELGSGREAPLYVDPYTGRILGDGSRRTRDFFRGVTDWHRWLAMKDEQRDTGRAITGACNLGFLFIVMSGFYLWWPKKWTASNLRSVTWFRRRLPARARDFNWHNVFGFWCAVPLFFVVLGAVFISYPWATDLLYRASGSEPPPRRAGARPPARMPDARPETLSITGLNAIWTRAEQHLPGWRSISLRLPSSDRAPVSVIISRGYGGQPQKRTTLTLDRKSANVTRSESFNDLERAPRLRSWFRFVHTGEYYGIPGQTIAGIASAGGVMLVWTGVSLALRRFSAWRDRRRKAQRRPRNEPVSV
jgi:uncharacterized iron-regulated membrane protein